MVPDLPAFSSTVSGSTETVIRGPHLPNGLLARLAAPALPMASLTLPLVIFLPEYYANALGMNLALVGLLFTIVRLGDLIFDPLVGSLMDRTETRWGQFRPWLVIGAPTVMTGVALLFMARPGVGAVRLVTGLVLAYIGYSIVILAQMGISSGLTPDYRERSRVFAWWQVFNTAGLILVMAMPAVAARWIAGDGGFTVRVMGWFVLVTTPITIMIALPGLREGLRPHVLHKTGFADYLTLLRVGSTRQLLLVQALLGLGLGISAAVFIFFFTILKQVPREYIGLQFVSFYIVGICSAPLWTLVANRVGKHRALGLGALGFSSYMLVMLAMPPGSRFFFGLSGLLGGSMACAADMLPRSIMSDVIDEDNLAAGHDRTGILFALLTVTHKLGQAVSIGVVFIALAFLGFKAPAGASNGALALNGLWVLYGILPALFYAVAGVFLLVRFRLTPERHAEIQAALAVRGSAAAGLA
jgi:GPH family glycoside/pentoside/hexuronide:cation symporter